jgi:serine O-acetyltransferase
VLGPIRVGDGARIGANAVVATEVPAGETVIGIPARPPHEHRVMPLRGAPAPSPGYGLGFGPCDPVGEELAVLRAEIAALRAELAELRRQDAPVGVHAAK